MKVLRQTLELGVNRILLSDPYRILHVAPVRSTAELIDLWFACSGDELSVVTKPFDVLVTGTGHQIDEPWSIDQHVGTCVMPSGFVWHVFAKQA